MLFGLEAFMEGKVSEPQIIYICIIGSEYLDTNEYFLLGLWPSPPTIHRPSKLQIKLVLLISEYLNNTLTKF